MVHLPHIYYKLRSFLDFKTRREWQKFAQLRARFYENLWREAAANTHADFSNWSLNYHRICRDGLTTVVNLSRVMLDNHLLLSVIGDKKLTYDLLSQKSVRVPEHIVYDNGCYQVALDFLSKQDGPVVIKPASGTGGGRGVTTGITNERDLRLASSLALRYGRTLMAEAQASGNSYRLLYLDGVFLDAIRRDSPYLTGDGKRTIKDLVAAENRKRLTATPCRALSPLLIDRDSIQTLSSQKLTPRSVPQKGQLITVKQSVNENSAQENHSVKGQVNPEIIEIGSRLVSDLGIRFAGLDIICTDISVSLEQSGGIINEINTTPGIHHHYLIADVDRRVPVAEHVLNHIFDSKDGILNL